MFVGFLGLDVWGWLFDFLEFVGLFLDGGYRLFSLFPMFARLLGLGVLVGFAFWTFSYLGFWLGCLLVDLFIEYLVYRG